MFVIAGLVSIASGVYFTRRVARDGAVGTGICVEAALVDQSRISVTAGA